MTEYEYMMQLSGVNELSQNELNKKWLDGQITNKKNIPLDFGFDAKIKSILENPSSKNASDANFENLANRLNSLLGSDNFKIERL